MAKKIDFTTSLCESCKSLNKKCSGDNRIVGYCKGYKKNGKLHVKAETTNLHDPGTGSTRLVIWKAN